MTTDIPLDEGSGEPMNNEMSNAAEDSEFDRGHDMGMLEVHQPESSSNHTFWQQENRIKEARFKLFQLLQGLSMGADMIHYMTAKELLECLNMTNQLLHVNDLVSLKLLYDHSIKIKYSKDLQKYLKRLIHELETQRNRKDSAKRLVNFLWSFEEDSNVTVADVNGLNITDTDIRSLSGRRWLSSNVVDVYLYLMTVKKVGYSVLPCSTMSEIIIGSYDITSLGNIAKLGNSITILSIYLKDNHFCLLIMDMKKYIIRWLDPASEKKEDRDNILKSIKQLVSNPDEWSNETLPHSWQIDEYNCGVYCLLFAEKYLANVEMTVMEEELEPFRYKVATEIMKFPVPLLNNLKESEIGILQVFNAFPQLRKCVPKRKRNTRFNIHIRQQRKDLPILRVRRRRRRKFTAMMGWARTRLSLTYPVSTLHGGVSEISLTPVRLMMTLMADCPGNYTYSSC